MKFFVAFAFMVAVASADMLKPTILTGEAAQIHEILAAIHSPSTHPATAAALEAMLLDVLGLTPDPVTVVEQAPEPIAVGPAIVDFPVPAEELEPSPVVVPNPAPVAEAATTAPLVQIILNIKQAQSAPVAPAPVTLPAAPVQVVEAAPVAPVQVVETAPVSPVQVVDVAPISPVQVVDVAPIQVIETAPIAVEPVIVGTPIIPSPAVVLPEELN